MLSIHANPEEFENATNAGNFRFAFDENLVREITWLSWQERCEKAPFLKCFPPTFNRKAGVFTLVWTVGLTVEINLLFQIQMGRGPNENIAAPCSLNVRKTWRKIRISLASSKQAVLAALGAGEPTL